MTVSEKQKEYQRRYKEKHREEYLKYMNEHMKKHYQKNKSAILEKKKTYYQQKKNDVKDNYEWKSFINNTSYKAEKRLFLDILHNLDCITSN